MSPYRVSQLGSDMAVQGSGTQTPTKRHSHTRGSLRQGSEGAGVKERRAESDHEAHEFQRYLSRYLKRGLCHRCAAQASYGHQHGFGRVHPPCLKCEAIVDSFPLGKANGWRAVEVRLSAEGTRVPGESHAHPHSVPRQGSEDAAPNACGKWTRHTNAVGCCPLCHELFSGDRAFLMHRGSGPMCVPPETVGLIARPSRNAPGEVVWGRPAPLAFTK